MNFSLFFDMDRQRIRPNERFLQKWIDFVHSSVIMEGVSPYRSSRDGNNTHISPPRRTMTDTEL